MIMDTPLRVEIERLEVKMRFRLVGQVREQLALTVVYSNSSQLVEGVYHGNRSKDSDRDGSLARYRSRYCKSFS